MAKCQNSQFSLERRAKLQKLKVSPKKSKCLNFIRFFGLIKEVIDISNWHNKFQDHMQARTFQNGGCKFFSGGNYPLPTGIWRLTLAPGKVVSPFFLNQNDHEGCRIDNLYRWLKSLSFSFLGKNTCWGVNHPTE